MQTFKSTIMFSKIFTGQVNKVMKNVDSNRPMGREPLKSVRAVHLDLVQYVALSCEIIGQ